MTGDCYFSLRYNITNFAIVVPRRLYFTVSISITMRINNYGHCKIDCVLPSISSGPRHPYSSGLVQRNGVIYYSRMMMAINHMTSQEGGCRNWSKTKLRACTLGFWDTVNTWRPRPNGRHFPDDIFKCLFLNGNIWILIKMSLTFVLNGPINNMSALFQIMAWHRIGDKPLSETMLTWFTDATSHCLNQWWLVYWSLYASLGLNELTCINIV